MSVTYSEDPKRMRENYEAAMKEGKEAPSGTFFPRPEGLSYLGVLPVDANIPEAWWHDEHDICHHPALRLHGDCGRTSGTWTRLVPERVGHVAALEVRIEHTERVIAAARYLRDVIAKRIADGFTITELVRGHENAEALRTLFGELLSLEERDE